MANLDPWERRQRERLRACVDRAFPDLDPHARATIWELACHAAFGTAAAAPSSHEAAPPAGPGRAGGASPWEGRAVDASRRRAGSPPAGPREPSRNAAGAGHDRRARRPGP